MLKTELAQEAGMPNTSQKRTCKNNNRARTQVFSELIFIRHNISQVLIKLGT